MPNHENDPGELRKIAKDLSRESNDCQFRLGDTLLVINSTRCYREWGFPTWKDYIEVELHLNSSASYELLNISRWAQLEGLTLTQRRNLSEIGRTKAYCVAALATKESLAKWIQIAKGKTCEEMRNLLYDSSPTEAPKTVSFWLYGSERRSITDALKIVQKGLGDDLRAGELLAEVCAAYVASHREKTRKAKPRKKSTEKKKAA